MGFSGSSKWRGWSSEPRTKMVVDPAEERLQREFEGVRRCYIPMHAIVRIDEVEKRGASRITEVGKTGNVALFPMPVFQPGRDTSES